ncbi:hypothetical protein D9M71_473240 [compost metagenome]
MHNIITRRLAGIPATTGSRFCRRFLGRFYRRLGGCNLHRSRLGRRCNRLGGRCWNRCRCGGNCRSWGWRRARSNAGRRCNSGHCGWLQGSFTGRPCFVAITHARSFGQRATHNGLRLAHQRQRHRLGGAGELDGRTTFIIRLRCRWLPLPQRQLSLLGRCGAGARRFVGIAAWQHPRRSDSNRHYRRQCQHMFFRHIEPHSRTLHRRAASNHGFDHRIPGDLVD